ncbi:MAG: cytochrome c biogenesis protein CcsA [Planctomycetota bacterium]|nr:cytochrome c biogenesis protein CcsA [Planctomycetota bacterium]
MKGLLDIRLHLVVAALLCGLTLGMVSWFAPLEVPGLGSSYLIVYFHLPSALNSLGFFLLGGVLSAFYLLRRDDRYDVWASSAIVTGLFACTITLVTGSAWARTAWGHWWLWGDPRLLSMAVTWYFFMGYVMLRLAVPEPEKRARFAAVFGIICSLNVPIVYFAIKIFGAVNHPVDVEFGTRVKITFYVALVGFALVYFLLYRSWVRSENARRTVERLKRIVYEA